MPIGKSELILNADGSIYHLNLFPEDIADTIITVGDPGRVPQVSQYFDTLEIRKSKREFHTHTGYLNKKRLTVISSGIGTDNIDIVLNELDALANVDFKTREVRPDKKVLDFIRIGTSGSMSKDIPLDSFLLSKFGVGLDGLLHFYNKENRDESELTKLVNNHLGSDLKNITPYCFGCDEGLQNKFDKKKSQLGITLTNVGFYGPQGRQIRLSHHMGDVLSKLSTLEYKNLKVNNLEMETSAIYGLSKLMGHRAISFNAILANRKLGTFSKRPKKTIDELIHFCLDSLT